MSWGRKNTTFAGSFFACLFLHLLRNYRGYFTVFTVFCAASLNPAPAIPRQTQPSCLLMSLTGSVKLSSSCAVYLPFTYTAGKGLGWKDKYRIVGTVPHGTIPYSILRRRSRRNRFMCLHTRAPPRIQSQISFCHTFDS